MSEESDARAFVQAWQQRAAALDEERLRTLRAMSEQESARLFGQVLCLPGPYPLRSGSGLVEQQRILMRLHTTNQ